MPHDHLHRRHARAAFAWPDPAAIASAIAAPFAEPKAQATITSYVYKTMSPTFEGSIAGYTTPGAPTNQPAAPTSTPDSQGTTIITDLGISSSTAAPQTTAAASTSSSLPSSILSPSTSVASTLPLLSATPTVKSSSSTSASAVSATTSASSSQDSTSSGSSEMTAGAKAGLAIGIILAIGAIASLVIFCIRQRRKKAQMQRLEDEKFEVDNDPFFGNRAPSTRTAKTASTAPRLSLRPVTQFLPGFGDNRSNGRANNPYPSDATSAVPLQAQSPSSRSAWERPINNDSQNRANPFGNHAEAIDPVNANGPSVIQGTSPGAERIIAGAATGAATTDAATTTGAATTGAAAGAAVDAATGSAAGLTRGASKRGFGPKPLDFTKTLPGVGPPSPAGTEFSLTETPGTPVQTSGAAAIAAAGGPQNSAVHRVQLDFKPSMDDELELRAGQLIRLLHEYDDGWALCIRLDRSQQGVVPRTCLSTRPVKPRPQQTMPRGNPSPGMRVPQQQQGRPMSPAMNQGQRSASPAGQRPTTIWPQANPQGRSASPSGNRPGTSGGPYGPRGGRSSPAPGQMQDRRNSPPGMRTPYGSPPNGTGPVGRKPVPGQAM